MKYCICFLFLLSILFTETRNVLVLPIEGVHTLTGTFYEERGCGNLAIRHPVTGKIIRAHGALDIGAVEGTPIRAVESGTVLPKKLFDYADTSTGREGYGNYIEIANTDGTHSFLYAHMSSYVVKPGDKVKKGDTIGYVGSTGLISRRPHLHLEKRDAYGNKIYFTRDFGIVWGVR